jgi:hypothetical protein
MAGSSPATDIMVGQPRWLPQLFAEEPDAMENYICVTCGTQYPAAESPPEHCPICEDDRQYINWNGQQWTTMRELSAHHHNEIEEEEPGLTGINTEPGFAIGQRMRVVRSPGGTVLWECISFVDDAAVHAIREMGGISAIAISHPHFYSSMVEWSHALGNVPIYLHADNREWVMHPDPSIVFWEGDFYSLGEGLTIVRCGGHFPGSSVLHWAEGADGHGVLLTGDTINVVSDRRYVSFMYSYPNQIPLPARVVRRIVEAVEPFPFERVYSSWKDKVIQSGGKEAVRRSAERYIRAIQG